MAVRGIRRLANTIGIQMPLVLPPNPRSVPDGHDYSPHLRFGTAEHELTRRIAEHMRRHPRGRFLDVGGGTGSSARHLSGRYDYQALDLVAENPDTIVGDICDCPEIPDSSFDIVYSWGTYEHLQRPWKAAEETARILKPGGLALVSTCFAWRFHPVPGDYFRFSHMALEQIFTDAGIDAIASGYDVRMRRDDRRGKLSERADAAPVDEMGGFRENWLVYYAGRSPLR